MWGAAHDPFQVPVTSCCAAASCHDSFRLSHRVDCSDPAVRKPTDLQSCRSCNAAQSSQLLDGGLRHLCAALAINL